MGWRGCLLGTGEAEEVASLLLDGGRPCGQGEGLLGGDGGNQGGSGAIHRDRRGAAFPQSRDCLVWQIAALHIRDRKRSVVAERSDRFTPPMLAVTNGCKVSE